MIGEMKRTVDVQSDLADGVDLSAPVPVGPDGLPGPPPVSRDVAPPRPRLCEQGPCASYHRLEIQLDAQDPRTQRLPVAPAGLPGVQPVDGGGLYTAPPVYHTQITHYCYPSPGVEMVLGDMPVVQCNRWRPFRPASSVEELGYLPDTVTPTEYLGTREGKAYLAEVSAWESARREETHAAAIAEAAILDAQVEYELGRCRIRTSSVTRGKLDGSREYQASCPEIAPDVAIGTTQDEANGLILGILRPYVRSRILEGASLPSSDDVLTKEHRK